MQEQISPLTKIQRRPRTGCSRPKRALPGAVLHIWQSDADGLYSGFSELLAGILRKVITDTEGRFELRTIAPTPYTVPYDGGFGRLLAADGWGP